jgi:hypothetical protein
MADEQTPDPFAQLTDWAEKTERRVKGARRRGNFLRIVPMVAAGAALVVLLALGLSRVFSPGPGTADVAYPTASAPDGITVTTSESAAPTDPFAGTPAAVYPKGAAGITMPTAKAVTGFTAAQVDAALNQVRKALIAGRLDDMMLAGHNPSRLIALLAPNQRGPAAKWFNEATFSGVATWIDPAVKLDPHEDPRVSGRVTYKSLVVDGLRTLRVTTNFVWVYAFAGLDHPLAAEHEQVNWEFPATRNLRAGDHGMWVGDSKSYTARVDCAAAARGLLAPTRPGTAPEPTASEDQNALLEADHALEIKDDCP